MRTEASRSTAERGDVTEPLRDDVLLVSHYYPPHLGGIETVVRNEAVGLAARGRRVTVVTSACGARPGIRWEDGVRVVRVPAWNGLEERFGIPFPLFSPALLGRLWREVGRARVVHAHDVLYLSTWLAGLCCRLRRTRYLLTQHVDLVAHTCGPVRLAQRLVHGTVARPLLRRAGTVLVLNDRIRAFVHRLGARPERIRLLHNGVDVERFSPDPSRRRAVRQRFGWPDGELVVLSVGRPVAKKGFDVLVAAADPAYRLVVAGATGDGGPAQYLGSLPPHELADVYRGADVFALPSRSEGFPLTVQEAMASGLPVVTTDDPAYACYQLDRQGIRLIPPQPEALRQALLELAASPDLRRRMGDWSRRTATARFSWGGHTDQLEQLYADAPDAA